MSPLVLAANPFQTVGGLPTHVLVVHAGGIARIVIVLFALVVLATLQWALKSPQVSGAIRATFAALSGVLALASLGVTVWAGHTGAQVAWGPIMDRLGS